MYILKKYYNVDEKEKGKGKLKGCLYYIFVVVLR
jgi:hypothetical protein